MMIAGMLTVPLKKSKAHLRGEIHKKRLLNIFKKVVQMIVDELIEDGEKIPEEPKSEVEVLAEPWVGVTV